MFWASPSRGGGGSVSSPSVSWSGVSLFNFCRMLVRSFSDISIGIHLVRLTEVCGKVSSEKYAYKSVKTALLLSNVIDAHHQNSCLFTNKCHFSLPLWVLMGVLAKFHE